MFRLSRGLSQEDLADTTSRTYLSDVERGRKAPTVEKLHYYAARLDVQTASIIALAESMSNASDVRVVLAQISSELDSVLSRANDATE